jgi:ubiquinone/menaquinone biosynthesis C-methylase UbiE
MNNWTNTAPTLWWGDPIDVRFLLADRLSEFKSKKILDLCCGHGIIMAEIEKSNYTVGLDISYNALNSAKKLNQNSNLINGDVMKLPFKDESFDVVYAAHSLPGYEIILNGNKQSTLNEWLKEIHRILKKEGVLLLTTPNRNYYAYKKSLKIQIYELKNPLSNYFNSEIKGFNPFPIYPGIIAKIPGIWNFLAFLMKIQLFEGVCKSFFVIAKPRK